LGRSGGRKGKGGKTQKEKNLGMTPTRRATISTRRKKLEKFLKTETVPSREKKGEKMGQRNWGILRPKGRGAGSTE